MKKQYKTWVEISGDNIRYNLSNIRKKIGSKVNLMVVVKSNAYGTGIKEMVREADSMVGWYGVDSVSEADMVRKFSKKPILILGYVAESEFKKVVDKDYSILFYTRELLDVISKQNFSNRKIKVHIKIDSGLNRLGFDITDLKDVMDELVAIKNIEVEGLCTHFAKLINERNVAMYEKPLNSLKAAKKIIESYGIKLRYIHSASSLATVLFKKTHLDMVRVGIIAYGLWGGRDLISLVKSKRSNLSIKPIICWKTRVIRIRDVKEGESIGYMNYTKFKKNTRIAVVGVGFYDGLDRRYAKNGYFLINGEKTKLLGKIAMNMSIVDISHINNVNVGEEVVIIGRSCNKEITVYDLAEAINISAYEIITRINPLLPRVLV